MDKRKKLLRDEYLAYQSDMKKNPRSSYTNNGYPFWNTNVASELLGKDEESGKAMEMNPKQ